MCRLSVRQFVWKYWIDYWFVCGGCRIQFDRLSIVKHCCISDCTLCYVLSLTSNFVRAYMTQQHDTDYTYWYSGTGTWNRSTGTGTWDSSTGTCTGTWMTEYWLQLWCVLSGTTRVSWYQKGKTKLKQETVSGSSISWAICKSAPRSRQITMPAPHHSVFTGRMPFLPPNQQCQSTEGTPKH